MNHSTVFQHLDDQAGDCGGLQRVCGNCVHICPPPVSSSGQVHRQHAQDYRLIAAYEGEEAIGPAGYRFQENLIYGRLVYVDHLVVTARLRRSGLGGELLAEVRRIAREAGCDHFVQRDNACSPSRCNGHDQPGGSVIRTIDNSRGYLQGSRRKLDREAVTENIGKRACGELAPVRVE